MAGETYTLTCRVEVVEGLPVSPTVTWRDSFNNPVTVESGITIGSPLVEGSRTTLRLSFSLLHTSHGGNYICSTSLEIEDIYNATLSEGFNVIVESEFLFLIKATVTISLIFRTPGWTNERVQRSLDMGL